MKRFAGLFVLAAALGFWVSAQHAGDPGSHPAPGVTPADPGAAEPAADPSLEHAEEEPAHGPETGLPAAEEVTSEPLHEEAAHQEHGEAHGEEHAEGEHHGHSMLGEKIWGVPALVWQTFNFLIFFGFLAFVLRKAIPAALKNRAEGIRAALAKAETEKAEAIAQLKVLEDKMGQLEGQVRDIEAQAKQEAEAEKVRAQEEAASERERIVVMAKQEMDRRVKEGREILRRHGADIAARLATEQAPSRIGPGDHEKLVARYADDLAKDKS